MPFLLERFGFCIPGRLCARPWRSPLFRTYVRRPLRQFRGIDGAMTTADGCVSHFREKWDCVSIREVVKHLSVVLDTRRPRKGNGFRESRRQNRFCVIASNVLLENWHFSIRRNELRERAHSGVAPVHVPPNGMPVPPREGARCPRLFSWCGIGGLEVWIGRVATAGMNGMKTILQFRLAWIAAFAVSITAAAVLLAAVFTEETTVEAIFDQGTVRVLPVAACGV